ncbi:MAG: glycosyltransferase [Pseudomonadota bacterium]
MTAPFAIIVPVYRHSALAGEAIATALDTGPVAVVAVDDGCPYPETRAMLAGWSARAPGRFFELHQPNRGLSAARNLGADFAIGHWPDLEALFFLDADNRLDPHSGALFGDLLAAHPEDDWFYPNFDMFGLHQNHHNGGPFSIALLAAGNQCEAGSLLRRRVWEAGIRFDETLRAGYEDWDFWLQAAERGFRGRPVRQSFFRYRKRPESMLAGSHTDDAQIRAKLHAKHRWIYGHDRIARAAASICDRYAVIETGDPNSAWTCTDPGKRQASTMDELFEGFHRAQVRGASVWQPTQWVISRPGILDALAERGLAQSVLWHLQTGLRTADISVARVRPHPTGRRHLEQFPPPEIVAPRNSETDGRTRAMRRQERARENARRKAALADADILMVSAARLGQWQLAKRRREPADRLAAADVGLLQLDLDPPDWSRTGAAPYGVLADVLTRLGADTGHRAHLETFAGWRNDPHVPAPRDIDAILATHGSGAAPFPVVGRDDELAIGFVVPIFDFGGAEKCAVALASALTERGVACHLFVYGNAPMSAEAWLTAPFRSIHQVNDWHLRRWRDGAYLGTTMPAELPQSLLQQIIAPLLGMDAVVATGTAALFHGLSTLRRAGVFVASWEHLMEQTVYHRPYGTPNLGVAYEGGLDRILTCSNALADWMAGQGVPRAKLLPLPNGPGFPLAAKDATAARDGRQALAAAPLRVGFLGRFDAQKGADRFLAIAQACRDLPLTFSMTGGAVVGQADLTPPGWIECHPAAYGTDALNAAFDRIDVLLMPSRAEGLPLTIMEAQRVGVIPVAADVGAVAEAIRPGETGYLLQSADIVAEAIALLTHLSQDPAAARAMIAPAAGIPDRWAANAEAFLAALPARTGAGERGKPPAA